MACYRNTARRQDTQNLTLLGMDEYIVKKPLGKKSHKSRNRLGYKVQLVLL
jgi:hypothetical protein